MKTDDVLTIPHSIREIRVPQNGQTCIETSISSEQAGQRISVNPQTGARLFGFGDPLSVSRSLKCERITSMNPRAALDKALSFRYTSTVRRIIGSGARGTAHSR